jgi:flagellar basal body-associated protein FliL
VAPIDDAPTAAMPTVPPERTQVIPVSPWHAQHEAPGQWHTQPPEHAGWHLSAPPEVLAQPEPIWSGGPQQPWQVPPAPARAGRRGAVWVSLALAATLLLCGGGAASAYLLLRDADSPGSADPATAVNRFLTAVYTQQDAAAADGLVCREARDKTKLTDRVNQIKTYDAGYQDPVYRWDEPTVANSGEDRAVVSVELTMSTTDEKTAREQLEFTVIRKTGWLVCEVAG